MDSGNYRNGSGRYHGSDGKFMPVQRKQNAGEDDKLTDRVEFRCRPSDYRWAQTMFHQHRAEFGWQIPSDMYRDLFLCGLADYTLRLKHPTKEMMRMKRQAEERQRFTEVAARHADMDQLCATAGECVDAAIGAGDLFAVRRLLVCYQEDTEAEPDDILRGKRKAYFERQWGSLWDSLNRNATLPIGDDDE